MIFPDFTYHKFWFREKNISQNSALKNSFGNFISMLRLKTRREWLFSKTKNRSVIHLKYITTHKMKRLFLTVARGKSVNKFFPSCSVVNAPRKWEKPLEWTVNTVGMLVLYFVVLRYASVLVPIWYVCLVAHTIMPCHRTKWIVFIFIYSPSGLSFPPNAHRLVAWAWVCLCFATSCFLSKCVTIVFVSIEISYITSSVSEIAIWIHTYSIASTFL